MRERLGFERMGFEMLGLEIIGFEMIGKYATPKKNKLKIPLAACYGVLRANGDSTVADGCLLTHLPIHGKGGECNMRRLDI